ncbi:HutD family protein [Sodalis ligni]|uniref:HutD/Ves family protein n=1 Tax=Sodalis ligni TaxID=2697027 RepID=UPI00193FBA8F|nr:HutD family protein [Sodalis ligni]QWA13542.1 HutD family protein [Sodalis ligni]
MSRPVRFSFDSLPVSRWRNGGGETREIVSWPADELLPAHSGPLPALDDFAWRASIATIDRDGGFSSFPGVDRVITLLEGNGVVLHGANGVAHSLTRTGEPYAFAGEESVTAVLAGGASRDFNIMTRRLDWRASVVRMDHEFILPAVHSGVLYVLAGTWRLGNDDQAKDDKPLAARDGCWWHHLPSPLRLRPLAPESLLLWADISAL